MTRSLPHLLAVALFTALPPATGHATQAATGPTVPQAQAAVDRLFEATLAEQGGDDTTRMMMQAFRPRVQAFSGCFKAGEAAPGSIDCITSLQGPDTTHRLLRFDRAGRDWTVQPLRDVPAPVPSVARAQALFRERIAAHIAGEPDPARREMIVQASRTAEVLKVENCAISEDAPVIECAVTGTAAGERGTEQVAFAWVEGQWQNATPP